MGHGIPYATRERRIKIRKKRRGHQGSDSRSQSFNHFQGHGLSVSVRLGVSQQKVRPCGWMGKQFGRGWFSLQRFEREIRALAQKMTAEELNDFKMTGEIPKRLMLVRIQYRRVTKKEEQRSWWDDSTSYRERTSYVADQVMVRPDFLLRFPVGSPLPDNICNKLKLTPAFVPKDGPKPK